MADNAEGMAAFSSRGPTQDQRVKPDVVAPGTFVLSALSRAVHSANPGWGKSGDRQAARRSIYIFSKRSLAVPELETLDAPDTTSSCEQRDVSTTGPQALIFLNGDFTLGRARQFASRLRREAGDEPSRQVTLAFELALGRRAEAAELRAGLDFLAVQRKQIESDGALARR